MLSFLNAFGFSTNYSAYLAAETNHTFKQNFEQTLSLRAKFRNPYVVYRSLKVGIQILFRSALSFFIAHPEVEPKTILWANSAEFVAPISQDSFGIFLFTPNKRNYAKKIHLYNSGLRIRNAFLGSESGIIIPNPDPTNIKTNF